MPAISRGHRSATTKYLKEIDEILEHNATTEATNESKTKLNTLKQQITGKISTSNASDEKILAVCDVKDINGEIDESENLVAKVTEHLVKLVTVIQETIMPLNNLSNSTGATNNTPTTINNTPITSSSRSRLPKLPLPQFKAEFTKWSTFWDSFKSAVHENIDINAVKKFNYLNSVLEGPAARAIQGLTLTDANYTAAVQLLEDRFDKPQQIISAHMEVLLKIPGCNMDRPASLRYVYDKVYMFEG